MTRHMKLSQTTGHRLKGCKILVVDDSKLNQIVVTQALLQEGATTETAINGEEALTILRVHSDKFDIVLMDVHMPVMDGLTATRLLRSEPGFADLPIIALSAGGPRESRQKALDAGLNDFLLKPVDLEKMVNTLHRWLPGLTQNNSNTSRRQLTPPEAKTTDLKSRFTNGLDIERGIATIGNDEALFWELIGELTRIHGDDADRIRNAVDAGDLSTATHLVHALKGVAGNLAATRVFQTAEKLDNCLALGDGDQIGEHLLRMEKAFSELRRLTLQRKEKLHIQKPAVPVPQPGQNELYPLFEELTHLLQHRCMDALDVMEQLGKRLAGTVFAADTALLHEAVHRLEFDRAKIMTTDLVKLPSGPALYGSQHKQ